MTKVLYALLYADLILVGVLAAVCIYYMALRIYFKGRIA